MKKLLLTVLTVIFAVCLYATEYEVLSDSSNFELNGIVNLPSSFNLIEQYGFSDYVKNFEIECNNNKNIDAIDIAFSRAMEIQHAYKTGVDNLRLNTLNYNSSENFNNFANMILPCRIADNKVMGFVENYYTLKLGSSYYMQDETLSFIKNEIYNGRPFVTDCLGIDSNGYNEDKTNNYGRVRNSYGCLIVGWDDNYSRELFANYPSGNGAFLVCPMKGDKVFDKGYLWVSYYNYWVYTEAYNYIVDYKPKEVCPYNTQYSYVDDWESSQVSTPARFLKVEFIAEKDGTLYGIKFADGNIEGNDLNKSYSIYLNDELKYTKYFFVPSCNLTLLKSVLNEDNPVSYKKGDKISVVLDNGKSINFLNGFKYLKY